MLDLFELGEINSNLIEITEDLLERVMNLNREVQWLG